MPRSAAPARKSATPETSDEGELVDIQGPDSAFASSSKPPALGLPFAPRRRLGHPNAADYHMPEIAIPARPPPKPKSKSIIESPYPIFWVEVFDEAHQKWFPVDLSSQKQLQNPEHSSRPQLIGRIVCPTLLLSRRKDTLEMSQEDIQRHIMQRPEETGSSLRVGVRSGGDEL